MRLLSKIVLSLIILQLFGCASNEKIAITPSVKTESALSHKAVSEALQLQGQPYVPGGKSPAEGFDCSGLVFYVYQKHGIKLPRDTRSLASQLPAVQLEQRQPGDLLFFTTVAAKPYSHVGIYVGEDKFVHAPSSRTGRVMMSDLNQPYWRERFTGVRRPHSQSLSMNLHDEVENLCMLN